MVTDIAIVASHLFSSEGVNPFWKVRGLAPLWQELP
jgi:hypothetical protein